jgi:hypothetical protein
MPDMDISIFFYDNEWVASIYYAGFDKEGGEIARHKDYGVVVTKVIEFLQAKT